MNRSLTVLLLCLLLSTLAASAGHANVEDQLRSGEIIAVDARPYRMVHEFAVHGGIVPTDAYYVGISLGGSYTLHLSDTWAWEALNFQYSANIDTGLESDLLTSFGVQPEQDPRLQYLMGTSAVFTPFFGKQAIQNKGLVFQSVYWATGGGIASFGGDAEDSFRPQINFGPGIRFFVNQVVSTRLDMRGIVTFQDVAGNIQTDFLFHTYLSFAFNFGKVRATEIGEDQTADTSTGYEKLDELFPKSNPSVVVVTEDGDDD